ncbi:MotA/TolQ/ExbB proton channel family protein [Alienimonas chondri]|uniref:MotA/TolQ/ExbB proton channel domain-containing protein n=1 Tax=Alienimonas chondri TaxID=2681879 RepID=A0ABX1V914_9PLAN|nr:MotA/TolQ/ExbB proton channel family protein [Alienimonas chondri]NNJ24274.1 hypothetical protein [Alienimonas chondri]
MNPKHKKLLIVGVASLLTGLAAPLVGLLATMAGMSATFGQIADSPTAPNPEDLASGVSEPLLTTLIGLAASAVFAPLGLLLIVLAVVFHYQQRDAQTPADRQPRPR